MPAKITVYSKNPCPYCVAAKNFLDDKGVAYEAIDLTGKMDEMIKLKEQTGWSTFPIILINGKVIGGYTDLKTLDEEGKLDSMLA
jgi:glutaredoxin 3